MIACSQPFFPGSRKRGWRPRISRRASNAFGWDVRIACRRLAGGELRTRPYARFLKCHKPHANDLNDSSANLGTLAQTPEGWPVSSQIMPQGAFFLFFSGAVLEP